MRKPRGRPPPVEGVSSTRRPFPVDIPAQGPSAARIKHPTFHPGVEYRAVRVIGQGAFGVVYCALSSDGTMVAIKKVKIDPRYKSRELELLRELDHPNVVHLYGAFKSAIRSSKDLAINLVMDYLPESLHQFNMQYHKMRHYPPLLYVKLFAFQLFSGLRYLHLKGITHRDIKPANVLIDTDTGKVRICDFGSAKKLLANEQSVAYIGSRYYRAPELIMNCVYYTPAIDIWAAGCCIAETLCAGTPTFIGETSAGQLEEIVKLLGRPTTDDLLAFQHQANIAITADKEADITDVLPKHTPQELIDLLKAIFVYNPDKRPTAHQCMQHSAFDELFTLKCGMPSGKPLPVLER